MITFHSENSYFRIWRILLILQLGKRIFLESLLCGSLVLCFFCPGFCCRCRWRWPTVADLRHNIYIVRWSFPGDLSCHLVEIIWLLVIRVAMNPLAESGCFGEIRCAQLQKSLVFVGYLPCNFFWFDIPVVRMAGVFVDTLRPIWGDIFFFKLRANWQKIM